LRIYTGVDTINSKRLLERFEAHLSSSALAPATVVNYVADLRAFLRWSEEAEQVDSPPLSLDISDIQDYCSFLEETRNHAPATINRRIQALRKFYGFAVAEGWASANPAEHVSLLSETASERSRYLTSADVLRLLEAVRQGRPRWVDRDWAIIQMFLGAGLKLSELTGLLLADVHLDADEPCLEISSAPDDPGRIVPLEAEVCDALRSYLAVRQAAPGVEHFFVNRDGNPLSTRSTQRLLRHYARAAKLDGLTTQALRYAYAKKLYENSGDLRTVTELLGHRHMATTVRYLRPSISEPEET
jgi:site-specific recombinase XerD